MTTIQKALTIAGSDTSGGAGLQADLKTFQELGVYGMTALKIETSFTHGAGCTSSAAITAGLAKGLSVREAVEQAKTFITAAIKHSFPLNSYVGPTFHAAHRLYPE